MLQPNECFNINQTDLTAVDEPTVIDAFAQNLETVEQLRYVVMQLG